MAIQKAISGLALDCFAEFTPAYEPGLAMTTDFDFTAAAISTAYRNLS